jgi:hypothetical protein
LGNLILRFPVEVNQRICQYSLLRDIFERAKECVELSNPRIELRSCSEEVIYDNDLAEMALEFGREFMNQHKKKV